MRLIDADALTMEIVNTASEASRKAWETGTHTYIDALNRLAERQHEIIDMIHDAPTINPDDLRPQGRWELKHIGVGHYWECSVCHTNPCIYVTENTKFCPNCGAKIDGKENEDA